MAVQRAGATARATVTAAYRLGAVTVTTLMILPARCALMMLADLRHAACGWLLPGSSDLTEHDRLTGALAFRQTCERSQRVEAAALVSSG